MAETVILGLDGCFDRASLGERTKSENVDYFIARGAELGFEVLTAGLNAVGEPRDRTLAR
jgi:predicted amino acid dehydrogenase